MGVTQPGLLQRTKAFFFPPGVASLAELEAFVTGEAAYLAQKTVFGYCRVKTVTNFEKLMTEPAFRDGVELCRWEAYAGTLGDTLVLVEGYLRPDDPALREALADRIAGLYPFWLNGHVPPHRTDWTDRLEAFAARFRAARIAPPVSPDAAVQETAVLIHTTVPLHDRLKRNDREVILGDLRLHALAMHSQMLKRFDRAALTAALLADGGS
ncbi:hypothetical protein [Ferrovibrio xuzhouensis]|uniref:Uncharacterized protein n=1 Tax=Ferrovibrio xuzhouensis TaxID=1576914 RepID=A0ABV7VA61_9PROT